MTSYQSSEQLLQVLKLLFGRVNTQNPEAADAVSKARLIIRLSLHEPAAEVVINGRKRPPEITYGPSSLRPDLDVDLSADALHNILLGELPLSKAVSSKQMKARGPIWKSFVLS